MARKKAEKRRALRAAKSAEAGVHSGRPETDTTIVDQTEKSEKSPSVTPAGEPGPAPALSRDDLFAQGISFEEKSDYANALRCFMACLSTLSPTATDSSFPRFVAQCLEKVSGTCYKAGLFDEAVRFAQAERSVYETLLLHAVAAPVNSADMNDDDLTSLLSIADEFGGDRTLPAPPAAAAAAAVDEQPSSADTAAAAAAGVADTVRAAVDAAAAALGGDSAPAAAAQAAAPRDDASLRRRIDACDRMVKLLTMHQKTDMARQYARRAIELRQALSGPEGLMQGLEMYGMSFADLGREDYKAALDRYRSSVARQLDATVAAARDADRAADMAAHATAPVSELAGEQQPFIPIEAFRAEAPRSTRTLRRSATNVALLVVVLAALIVGLGLVVYGLGVVQERGLYVSDYDDTVFNGIKLNVRDLAT